MDVVRALVVLTASRFIACCARSKLFLRVSVGGVADQPLVIVQLRVEQEGIGPVEFPHVLLLEVLRRFRPGPRR